MVTLDAATTCVYTCLFGGYETLTEQPAAPGSSLEFVCFTDDPGLTSDTWRIEVVDRVLPLDAPRSSRHPKLFPHRYLDEAGSSLYIDNSVRLRRPPDDLLETALADPATGLALARHSFHGTLEEEARAVIEHGFEEPGRVAETLAVVDRLAPGVVGERPFWGGLLIRRHDDPAMRLAMDDWWTHVLRYSRRDQLSLPLVLDRHAALCVSELELDNHRSEHHEWPLAPRPGRADYIASATRRGAGDDPGHPTQDAEVERLRSRNETLEAVVSELTESWSWRATAPVRAAARRIRRNDRPA